MGTLVAPGTVIHAASCEQAPPQAVRDRATYSAAELARYGLPQRSPGEPFDRWARVVRSAGKRVCDRVVTNLKTRIEGTSDKGFTHWAGNMADEPNIFNPETYSEIDVEFHVPCVNAGNSSAEAVFWAGLGGWNNSNLVQTGVQAERVYVANNGWFTIYHAWVENVAYAPNPYLNQTFGVYCNDLMYAKVSNGNCMFVEDFSAGGQNSNQCYGPGANQTSAEAIAERPTLTYSDGSTGLATLANFGTMTFLGTGITDNGSYKGMDQVNHDYTNMWATDGSHTLASVGPIYYDGSQNPPDDFNVTWQSYT